MVEAFNAIKRFADPERKGNVEAVSPLSFLEAMVTYRNRVSGHGAPQRDHVETFTPILEAGLVDLLQHLSDLKNLRLVFLSEIRLERQRFVHVMTRLMGNSPLALADYVSSKEDALLGHDRTLLVFDDRNDGFLFSLHPLVIYATDDVFILQSSDLKRSVEYLSHDTGATYIADQIFDDFKQHLGPYLGDFEPNDSTDKEGIYIGCLRMSLLDGVIEDDERRYLEEMREQLGLSISRARELEESIVSSSEVVREQRKSAEAPPGKSSLSVIVEQQNQLLQEFGSEVLRFLSSRKSPSDPMRLDELATGLSLKNKAVADIPRQQFARLIGDVLSHGFAPGLVKLGGGYAIVEDHIAFKLTRGRDLKREIARAAVALLDYGAKIGLDGGSTTLPIAEELVSALESELIGDVTIVTNSLPVAQMFADFVERRGWSDNDCPVMVLIATGQIRAVTKAIADLPGNRCAQDSLLALTQHVGGLDYCFVGANGLTLIDGITMPTEFELPIKQQLLSSAREPFIVADVTKFGHRFPVKIADWSSKLTLLTNKPAAENAELDAVLNSNPTVQIVFAEVQS
jgi:DeoR/GlpR family transcriptional regulator of sugar metabolism